MQGNKEQARKPDSWPRFTLKLIYLLQVVSLSVARHIKIDRSEVENESRWCLYPSTVHFIILFSLTRGLGLTWCQTRPNLDMGGKKPTLLSDDKFMELMYIACRDLETVLRPTEAGSLC